MNTPSLITQSKLLLAAAVTICTLFPAAVLGGPAVLDSAINPANGHTYYLLGNSDWTDAENAAVALGGHLATVRSLAENNWILNRFGTNGELWIGLHDPIIGDGGGAQHAADFVWSSGETSSYRNWHAGEPNGDDYAYMFYKGSALAGLWNDNPTATNNLGEPPFYGVAEVTAGSGGPAILDSAINPANGHTYYLLANSDWTDAESAAIGLGGHLATIRSLAENNWIWDRWGTNRTLLIGLYDPVTGDGGGTQHAANFVWTSGDSSAYRNWRSGEPNGDDYTYILAKGVVVGGVWNDDQNLSSENGEPPMYGVAEVAICTPHHATATAVLFNTFVVGANITDSGCGYTNAPLVSIQGGGGSGATAMATVANGVVTAVNIINPGSGYTNAPQIIIASPPFVPTVAISVSAVKVAQHLMLGNNYILQSSPDLVNWTAVGPAFTATNEDMVSEFEINATGQYFRILQVP